MSTSAPKNSVAFPRANTGPLPTEDLAQPFPQPASIDPKSLCDIESHNLRATLTQRSVATQHLSSEILPSLLTITHAEDLEDSSDLDDSSSIASDDSYDDQIAGPTEMSHSARKAAFVPLTSRATSPQEDINPVIAAWNYHSDHEVQMDNAKELPTEKEQWLEQVSLISPIYAYWEAVRLLEEAKRFQLGDEGRFKPN